MARELGKILEIEEQADGAPANADGTLPPVGGEVVSQDFQKARKAFRGLGYTVIVLGLISFMFLGDASESLAAGTVLAVALCVISGIWHVSVPSVASGVVAGIALAILGLVDLALGAEGSGPFAVLPSLIDFGWAVKMFVGSARFSGLSAAKDAST